MNIFSNRHIRLATTADSAAITQLLNSAYRGESSKQGWTTEAHLIAGNSRTNEATVRNMMQQPNNIFLVYSDDENIIGCVNLQQHDQKIYLGMFSVSPLLQGAGIGKAILQAAEEYATQNNCNSIYMTVISVRHELINWYKRHGYSPTGESKPLPNDADSGTHLQQLELLFLEKQV